MPTITIPGAPIAKKRPRFARRGNFVTTYNAQETEESRVLWEIKQQYSGEPSQCPVSLDVKFLMPIPASTSRKKAVQMLSGEIRHTKKPDLDNCLKFIKDVCNGTVWKDDSQIVYVQAEKYYSDAPQTILKWEELG